MKLAILAIVLGVLGIIGYVNFQLSGQALIPQMTETGVLYGVRDWTFGMVFAVVGAILIALGLFRIKRVKAKQ